MFANGIVMNREGDIKMTDSLIEKLADDISVCVEQDASSLCIAERALNIIRQHTAEPNVIAVSNAIYNNLRQQGYDTNNPLELAKAAVKAMNMEDTCTRKDQADNPVVALSSANSSEISVVDEAFVVEHIWRLFDQFQSPMIGNRSPKTEESAKIMAKRVFDKLSPYLRTLEPVMSNDSG